MKNRSVILLLLAFALASQAALGQTQQEKDRQTFINNAKLLEKKPFDPNASIARERAFKWLIETKDVSVSLCSDTMKLIPEKKNKFKSELFMQFSFGMAVFKLENPDKSSDENASNLAGLESVLRTYEAMISSNEKAKNSELDAMLLKRNGGELKSIVDAAVAGCAKEGKK